MATVTPTPRFQHISAAVGHRVFVWGGWTKSMPLNESKECVLHDKKKHPSIVNVDVLDMSTGTWKTFITTGEPHKGIVGAACTVIGEYIFVFGGYCGHDFCFYNSITRLDTKNMTWEEFAPDCDTRVDTNAPKKKRNCAMVLFNESILCIVGGEGPYWPHSMETSNIDYSQTARCASRENEVHCFDLSTRHWFAPSISGEPPPPCCHHTLINIHGTDKALLIGGFSKNGKFSIAYELTMSIEEKKCNWAQVRNNPQSKMSQRSGHTCTNVGKAHALLIGGEDYIDHSLDEVWLLHCDTMGHMAWTKKEMESVEGLAKRSYHTATFIEYNKQMWLIIVGGISEWMSSSKCKEQKILSDTSILQLTFDEGNEVDIIPFNVKCYRQMITSKNLQAGETRFEYEEVDVIRYHVAESSITLYTSSESCIHQIWSKRFKFERNLYLISEVFLVYCRDSKPVSAKLQHCAAVKEDDENVFENLRFMVCDDPEFGPPYEFKMLEGHRFTQYFGEIKIFPTTKFLAICQKVECSYEFDSFGKYILDPCYGQRYFAAIYLNEENRFKTEACLAVCQYLEGKKEDMKNQLEQQGFRKVVEMGDILTNPDQKSLRFSINEGRNKNDCQTLSVNGWKVTLTDTNPQLDLSDVDKCIKFDSDEYPLKLSFEKSKSSTEPVTISLDGWPKKKQSLFPKCLQHDPHEELRFFSKVYWLYSFLAILIVPFMFSYLYYGLTNLISPEEDSNTAVGFPTPKFAGIGKVIDEHFVDLITNPQLLCMCFHVDRVKCEKLKKEYAGSTKEYVMHVVYAWHDQFSSLMKEDVYKALLCTQDMNAAKDFRQKHSKQSRKVKVNS